MRSWIAVVALAAGCFNPVFPPGRPCAAPPDRCPGDLICVEEVCVAMPGASGDDAAGGDARVDADPDSDQDLDGIADADDNCPSIRNSDQYDEDLDAVGDVCDVCPHVQDVAQVDGDSDGVGNACDPDPTVGTDSWVEFQGFNDPVLVGWTLDPGWQVMGGRLRSPPDVTHLGRALHDAILTDAYVASRATITAVDPNAAPAYRSAAVLTASDGTKEYRCILRDVPAGANAAVLEENTTLSMTSIAGVVLGSVTDFVFLDQGTDLSCKGNTTDGRVWTIPEVDGTHASGQAGVRVQHAIAEFSYVAIIAPGP